MVVQRQKEVMENGTAEKQVPSEKQIANEIHDTSEKQDPCEEQKAVDVGNEDQAGTASKESEKNKAALTESESHSGTPTDDPLTDADTENAAKPDGDKKQDPATDTTYTPDLTQYDTGSIAIYEQAGKQQSGPFRFSGYYKITRLQYLAPQSADLFRMLEQKFSTVDRFGRVKQRQRSAASWEASMSFTWAVVKMEPDEEANANLPPPKIEVRDVKGMGNGTPKRSVNELLEEMRLKE